MTTSAQEPPSNEPSFTATQLKASVRFLNRNRAWLLLIAGVISLLTSLYLTRHETEGVSWKSIAFEALEKVGEIFILGGFFDFLMKSDDYIKYFEERLLKSLTCDEYSRYLDNKLPLLITGKDLLLNDEFKEQIWRNVCASQMKRRLPQIEVKVANALQRYFVRRNPDRSVEHHHYYYRGMDVVIDVKRLDGSKVEITEKVEFTIVTGDPSRKISPRYTCKLDDPGTQFNITLLEVDGNDKLHLVKPGDLKVTLALEGKEYYHVQIHKVAQQDLAKDPLWAVTTSSIADGMTVYVKYPDLNALWINKGAIADFGRDRKLTGHEFKAKCDGLLFPKQGCAVVMWV